MVTAYYNKTTPTSADILSAANWLAANHIDGYEINSYNGTGLYASDLVTLAKNYFGFTDVQDTYVPDINTLYSEVEQGHPVIVGVLTNMGRGPANTDHFMVLRGFKLAQAGVVADTDHVIVNDPGHNPSHPEADDYSGYTVAEFKAAWKDNGYAAVIIRPSNTQPSATFTETFNNSPVYTNNWQLGWNTGSTALTYSPGNLRLQASRSFPYPPASAIGLLSKQTFSGDVDLTIELNHQGSGQSKVGLFGLGGVNSSEVWFDLDTDDVACLWMSRTVGGQGATTPICPSSPYMNRWLTLRISIKGQQASYYADGALLLTIPYPNPPGSYLLGFGASSVPWKSSDNDTSFRRVAATATAIH
jgi:hypothetical protein